jgi:lyso-ornithine lipid O-acyltransferase
MLRLGLVIAGFTLLAAGLIALQWCLAKLNVRGRKQLSVYFYRALCRLLRVRVRVVGAPIGAMPVLIVANHTSWLDIPVIASIMPAAFVAKSEVRGWPLVGLAAELTGAVFVDRARRQNTADVNAAIADRIAGGDPVVLFAEGTSSDGNRVLQFRSALVGAASGLLASEEPQGTLLQPLSIVYTHVDGLPMGRQHRPLVAWYGDTDFMPHLKDYVRCGAVDAVVTFGEPVSADGMDRKTMVKSLESTVRRLTSAALRGERAPANTA